MSEQPTDQPTEQPADRPTDSPVLESAEAAALRLGVSRNAVLQRIKRGTLAGQKVDGVWWVVDGGDDRPTEQPTSRPTTRSYDRPTEPPSVSAIAASARGQLEAIRDEWLAPLVAQITEQAEMIGELRTELDHEREQAAEVQAERDTLRARVRVLEAQQTEFLIEPESAPSEQLRRAWWRFWEG